MQMPLVIVLAFKIDIERPFRHLQDFRVAKALLLEGWKEHDYERHWQPFSFPDSDGGVMFERCDPVPDHHLDSWHPLEKVGENAYDQVCFVLLPFCPSFAAETYSPSSHFQAFYPDYFARREKRKQEFIDRWNKQYGTPTQDEIDEALWWIK